MHRHSTTRCRSGDLAAADAWTDAWTHYSQQVGRPGSGWITFSSHWPETKPVAYASAAAWSSTSSGKYVVSKGIFYLLQYSLLSINSFFLGMEKYPTEWAQFFTASIYKKKFLLDTEKRKMIIINCLRFLITEKRIKLFAYVIMDNHFHVIWQPLNGQTTTSITLSFLKFTGMEICKSLLKERNSVLKELKTYFDRRYRIWKRKPLSIELRSHGVFDQKLIYIHENPVKAGICKYPEEYKFSSAVNYATGKENFGLQIG